jgi:hypothetical protein
LSDASASAPFSFDALPSFSIGCAATLKTALEALSWMGERCPGRLDAAVPLACSGPAKLDAVSMAQVLCDSGFALSPLYDSMGAVALFFELDRGPESRYAQAWSALENRALEGWIAPGAAPSGRGSSL